MGHLPFLVIQRVPINQLLPVNDKMITPVIVTPLVEHIPASQFSDIPHHCKNQNNLFWEINTCASISPEQFLEYLPVMII